MRRSVWRRVSRTGAALVLGWAAGTVAAPGAWGVEYDLDQAAVTALIERARAISAEELEAEYTIPEFDLGDEKATVLMATKSYEIMARAIEDEGFGAEESTPVLRRKTFDVVLTVRSGPTPHPPQYYHVHIFQNGKIILPVDREERSENGHVVVRAKFREQVLDPRADGVLQIYPGGVSVHDPGAKAFPIAFSELK